MIHTPMCRMICIYLSRVAIKCFEGMFQNFNPDKCLTVVTHHRMEATIKERTQHVRYRRDYFGLLFSKMHLLVLKNMTSVREWGLYPNEIKCL